MKRDTEADLCGSLLWAVGLLDFIIENDGIQLSKGGLQKLETARQVARKSHEARNG